MRFFLWICLLWSGWVTAQETGVYQVSTDYMSVDMKLVYQAGRPDHYQAEIYTPVCTTGTCLPVKIIIYWDLLGNYLKYKMPENEILTKNDDAPFSPFDYNKFDQILRNEESILENFDLSLMESTLNQSIERIDGISSATPKAINDSIVEGAFFTCYSIWHLVYGGLAERAEAYTHKITDDDLLRYMLNDKRYAYQHYAVDIVTRRVKETHWAPLLIDKLVNGNVFMDQHIIKAFPLPWLTLNVIQQRFWNDYLRFSYGNKREVINRFDKVTVHANVADGLPVLAKKENKAFAYDLFEIYLNSLASSADKEAAIEDFLLNENTQYEKNLLDLFDDYGAGNTRIRRLVEQKREEYFPKNRTVN
ncbi:MAG: hypothetical protein OEX02_18850 [Cyclobacteriaceae bacterium]|nr:hypothetical protein [Cyclobacteriaceae bacterium]